MRPDKSNMKMYMKKSGFTLVEILVASTIGTFVSLIAVGTLHSVITGSDMVEKNINAASEVRFACNIFSRDLVNFYHADSFEDTEFYAITEAYTEFETAHLYFYTVNRAKARIYEPECDIYEVEYYLDMEDDESLSLKRRVWPNPNLEFEPGGILTTIAENIEYFDVSYFDGETWYTEWPEDMESPPDLVEFTIMTRPLGLGNYISETHLVNLVRQVNETEATVQ
ncbi:MAG: prepilin-type N-terminal cleavage/methylation domain-containing protein [Sedimentisphaerales bacterium]|nr:prepilin-type N-terminal cleavage/methylation domain-containing protein [Sedimentisphaerales bacterium]